MTLGMIPREQMLELLRKHREVFAGYARNHRDKVGPLRNRVQQTKADSATETRLKQQIADTIAKAEANEAHVAEIDELIGKPVRSPDTKAVDQG